jgi:hypothetical protein
MGDLGFFGIGEKDYSETFSVGSCFSNGQMFPPSHRLPRDLPSSDYSEMLKLARCPLSLAATLGSPAAAGSLIPAAPFAEAMAGQVSDW